MTTAFLNTSKLRKPEYTDQRWDIELNENWEALSGIIYCLNTNTGVETGFDFVTTSGLTVTIEAGVVDRAGVNSGVAGFTGTAQDGTTLFAYVDTNNNIVLASTMGAEGSIPLYMIQADGGELSVIGDIKVLKDILPTDAIYNVVSVSTGIVDAFIYNTALDSDGGLWRKRCAGLSWYEEELNTATRGKTKAFPALSLIVVTSNTVTIYDLTDKDLPMWMVFNNGDGAANAMMIGYSVSTTFTGMYIKEGVLVTGEDYNVIGALKRVDFIKDSAFAYTVASSHYTEYPYLCGQWGTGIANRNTPYSTAQGYFGADATTPIIVNTNINAVAMTVIPDAPIDQETGLPVPTIAVGTNGGVSVIDGPAGVGTVVNITWLNAGYVQKIVFFEDNSLATYSTPAALTDTFVHIWTTIPSVDPAPAYAYHKGSADRFYSSPAYSTSADLNILLPASGTATPSLAQGGIGSVTGLNILKENPMTPAAGMVNFITADYQSAWQVGDSRLATLSTVTPGLLGDKGSKDDTELIINGDFTTDISSWGNQSSGDSTVVWEGGAARYDTVANGTGQAILNQNMTVIAGYVYEITATMGAGVQISLIAGSTQNGFDLLNSSLPAGDTHTFQVRAINDLISLTPFRGPGGSNFTAYLENITLKNTLSMVLNGTFDENIDGWGSIGTIEPAWLNGAMLCQRVSNLERCIAEQSIATNIGDVYEVTFESVTHEACFVSLLVGNEILLQSVAEGFTYVATFKATEITSAISFFPATDGTGCLIDNVSVTPIRSVIENGEFSSDRAWTLEEATIAGGQLTLPSPTVVSRVRQDLDSSVMGKTATLTYEVISNTGVDNFVLYGGYIVNQSITLDGTVGIHSLTFNCDGPSSTIMLRALGGVAGVDSIVIDNISLQLFEVPDYSVKGNDLEVIGTIDAQPVNGGELCAYSGFSENDYIQQEYTSDLDFGTGDFCCMGWVYTTGHNANQVIASNKPAAESSGIILLLNATENVQLRGYEGGAWSSGTSTTTLSLNQWHFVCCSVSNSGADYSIYINGVLDATNTDTPRNIASASPLVFGQDGDNQSYVRGSLALCGMAATAPTAEQIKFIYDTEKRLFNPGALATLAGDSSDVQSVSYDPFTDTTMAATSTGVSYINGCQVLDKNFLFVQDGIAITPTTPYKVVAHLDGTEIVVDSARAAINRAELNTVAHMEEKQALTAVGLAIPTEFYFDTATVCKIDFGYSPHTVYKNDGTRVFEDSYSVDFDGFCYYVTLAVQDSYRIMCNKIPPVKIGGVFKQPK